MKRVSRSFAILLAVVMVGVAMWTPTLEAAAADNVVSGTCSTSRHSIEWSLDNATGKLTISGSGDMCLWCNDEWNEYQDKIKTVEIKTGVTSIGDFAFYGCSSLTSITIPEGVTSIGEYAFQGCSSLTSITIPEGVTSIGWAAFYICSSLKDVYAANLESWLNISFDGCTSNPMAYAKNLYINNEILTEVVIPEGVTSIGKCAFEGCSSLTSITIPEGVTSIGVCAFHGCSSLTSITIPEGVTSIGDVAFHGCSSLTSITIPEGVTNIGDFAFYGCSSLTSIMIPESVTSIGDFAFCVTDRLTDIYYSGTKEQWNQIQVDKEKNPELDKIRIHYNTTKICKHNNTKVQHKKAATLTADGYTGDVICTACNAKIKSGTKINRISSVRLSKVSYTYNGRVQKPSVVVKDRAGRILKTNTDYTIRYASGCQKVGKYKVTVTFKGNYAGTKTLTYTINPKNTTLKSVTKGSKHFIAKWSRQTSEVTGYQIRYSLKKNMSGSKTITVNKAKITSYTVKKLKGNKKYYVQIRTYKKVNNKNYYSLWSSAKTVTTKK